MKSLLAVCFLGVVALAMAKLDGDILYPRGCRYILGACFEECPEGTHAYAVGCDYITREPTCEEPIPEVSNYMICDYSSCYCDPPTVRDRTTDRCVPFEQCPNK